MSEEPGIVMCTEEQMHFNRVIATFESYGQFTRNIFLRKIQHFDTLPMKQQNAMSRYKEKLHRVLSCINQNQYVISHIIKDVEQMFDNIKEPVSPPNKHIFNNIMSHEIDKVQVTLKQLFREWSKEGTKERDTCYKPIIDEIVSIWPPHSCKTQDIQVLVPGAGLGRLAFEIAKRGYTCQGNEFSLFMLFASNFILNKCHGTNIFSIYPWVLHVDNYYTVNDEVVSASFPDINPTELRNLVKNSKFTMVAGDFLDVYKYPDQWDCVATCFFIDCTKNIYLVIENIYRILKPGGVWINIGPLQYHFSGQPDSLEPSYQVVKDIIYSIGFVLKKEKNVQTSYTMNTKSMFKFIYDTIFSVCMKPVPPELS